MINSNQGYICNLFIKLIWMEMKKKETNIKFIQMVYLDGSSKWKKEQRLKYGCIIWMGHIDGSTRWK